MKILISSESREADRYTITHEPVSSIHLMERAAEKFVNRFLHHFTSEKPVVVLCGPGNNGGDGLAIARILLQHPYSVTAFIIQTGTRYSPDFQINLERLNKILKVKEITASSGLPAFRKDEIIIDALFGTGLSKPIDGLVKEVINAVNASGNKIVSVDIASGLFADQPQPDGPAIKPFLTISLQMPKLAFFIPENEVYSGHWETVDIGINQEFINQCHSKYYTIDGHNLAPGLIKRKKFSHKGDFGKVLLISGSFGKMGAATLGAKACLRSGAGLVTVHVPRCGYEIIQSSVPEAMVSVDHEMNHISGLPDLSSFDSIGVGPGIGMPEPTINMMGKLLGNYYKPMVLDADALNIISKNIYLMEQIPAGSILTPHIKEFERLTGPAENHYKRLDLQRILSEKYGLIIILKGAYSSVSLPDGSIFFNTTGNPGMATGGSGDALTGILTALLGQGYPPEKAALLGVFLHGLAGDLAAEVNGFEGLMASDLIHFLPEAFIKLKSQYN